MFRNSVLAYVRHQSTKRPTRRHRSKLQPTWQAYSIKSSAPSNLVSIQTDYFPNRQHPFVASPKAALNHPCNHVLRGHQLARNLGRDFPSTSVPDNYISFLPPRLYFFLLMNVWNCFKFMHPFLASMKQFCFSPWKKVRDPGITTALHFPLVTVDNASSDIPT